MAYQPRQGPDPYYSQPHHNNYAYSGNTGVPDYPPSHHDHDTNWETKSYTSTHAGSQVHLNPYEMSQVNHPPMPGMPYGAADYPPVQQRPGMYHHPSSAGYSVAREKMMKRRSVRQVELFRGNLVIDVPVPSHIVPSARQGEEEMTKMRYTAATCDPDDFMATRYSLRQYLWNRQTELFIVMTMYNEDEILFCKTMNA
jgi:chitin synthase